MFNKLLDDIISSFFAAAQEKPSEVLGRAQRLRDLGRLSAEEIVKIRKHCYTLQFRATHVRTRQRELEEARTEMRESIKAVQDDKQ